MNLSARNNLTIQRKLTTLNKTLGALLLQLSNLLIYSLSLFIGVFASNSLLKRYRRITINIRGRGLISSDSNLKSFYQTELVIRFINIIIIISIRRNKNYQQRYKIFARAITITINSISNIFNIGLKALRYLLNYLIRVLKNNIQIVIDYISLQVLDIIDTSFLVTNQIVTL